MSKRLAKRPIETQFQLRIDSGPQSGLVRGVAQANTRNQGPGSSYNSTTGRSDQQQTLRGSSLSRWSLCISLPMLNYLSHLLENLAGVGLKKYVKLPGGCSQSQELLAQSQVRLKYARADTVPLFSLGPHLPAHSVGELSHAA